MIKISDLKKGLSGSIPALGKIVIVGVAKKYIRVKQVEFGGIVAKVYFKNNDQSISDIKLTLWHE